MKKKSGKVAPRKSARGEASTGSRESLLRAAEAVIVTDGVGAVTIRRVAGDAGVSISLIAYHFGSVDDLVAEVMNLNLDAVIQAQKVLTASADMSSLSSIMEAYLRPLWCPAAFNPRSRAALIIQDIYRRAPAKMRARADARLEESFLPLTRAMQKHLSHLDRAEVVWRLCALAGMVLSMSQEAPSWRLFHGITTLEHFGEPDSDYARMLDFALTLLMAPQAKQR